MFQGHSVLEHAKNSYHKHKKSIAITATGTFFIAAVFIGGTLWYTSAYEDRIYPNVYVNSTAVGGMTVTEAQETLQMAFDSMLEQGLAVTVEDTTKVIQLRSSGATDPDLVQDRIYFDADQAAESALAIGRNGDKFTNHLYSLLLLVKPLRFDNNVTVLTDDILDSIHRHFESVEQEGSPAQYDINATGDTYSIAFVAAEPGQVVDTQTLEQQLATDVLDFDLPTYNLALVNEHVAITEEDALSFTDDIIMAIAGAPYSITYTNDLQREYTWTLRSQDIVEWIAPVVTEDGDVAIALEHQDFDALMHTIEETVNVAPQNAKFQIENGRVTEFSGSQSGAELDTEQTIEDIHAAFGTAESVIPVTVSVVDAEVSTGSVNDFGIETILGVGVSDFSGSPSNRIANIQHGAAKLDGLLIPPGETISLVETLKPFTIEDGYLPELVIKGDEIKPEVGGGLCQIGTTTFRAAMNSGLEIVERRNHSLVVSYYNDPTNNNPGTDATIYDPAPDFKFRNDTEHHILLTTEVDVPNRQLYFTFWGTDDGREGYYSAPQVLSWTGYGETQYTETPDLAPGVERCQAPHPGATTTFTYYVDYADGTRHEKVYESTYRSLPRICLVGAADASSTDESSTETSTETGEELTVDDVSTETTE